MRVGGAINKNPVSTKKCRPPPHEPTPWSSRTRVYPPRKTGSHRSVRSNPDLQVVLFHPSDIAGDWLASVDPEVQTFHVCKTSMTDRDLNLLLTSEYFWDACQTDLVAVQVVRKAGDWVPGDFSKKPLEFHDRQARIDAIRQGDYCTDLTWQQFFETQCGA